MATAVAASGSSITIAAPMPAAPVVPTHLSTPVSLPRRSIMVGSHIIRNQLSQLLQRLASPLRTEIDPQASADCEELVFVRDSRVVLLDATHLVPYSIQSPAIDGRFMALLPATSHHFIESTDIAGYGEGCNATNTQRATEIAQQLNIPFTRGRSTIEGGNCFVFRDSSGTPKAILGIHSLVLTYIGLEEQGYFNTHEELWRKIQTTVSSPSEHALRIARNISVRTRRRSELENQHVIAHSFRDPLATDLEVWAVKNEIRRTWGSERNYRRLLNAPLTSADRRTHCRLACEIEAKLSLAKQVIAQELGVSLDDMALVPQIHFHIDMEMFVVPSGTAVYLHDDEVASEQLLPYHTPLSQRYLQAANHRLRQHPDVRSQTVEALRRIGCKCVLVPGIFYAPNERTVNFMNSCLVAGPTPAISILITNGCTPEYQRMFAIFQRALRHARAPFQVALLDHQMQDILNHCHAGIHCLTWEKTTPAPSAVILSYLTIDPGEQDTFRRIIPSCLRA